MILVFITTSPLDEATFIPTDLNSLGLGFFFKKSN